MYNWDRKLQPIKLLNSDCIDGKGGNDRISGLAGNDKLTGRDRKDLLRRRQMVTMNWAGGRC